MSRAWGRCSRWALNWRWQGGRRGRGRLQGYCEICVAGMASHHHRKKVTPVIQPHYGNCRTETAVLCRCDLGGWQNLNAADFHFGNLRQCREVASTDCHHVARHAIRRVNSKRWIGYRRGHASWHGIGRLSRDRRGGRSWSRSRLWCKGGYCCRSSRWKVRFGRCRRGHHRPSGCRL